MKWSLLLVPLLLASALANAQSDSVTITACNTTTKIKASHSTGTNTYSLTITQGGHSQPIDLTNGKKKSTKDDIQAALDNILQQSNILGSCPGQYGLIADLALRFRIRVIASWFPDASMTTLDTEPINENYIFSLVKGNVDKKCQLVLSQPGQAALVCVTYDYSNHVYTVDWATMNTHPEILGNFYKFLKCYNSFPPGSTTPSLYLLPVSDNTYSVITSTDDLSGTANNFIVTKKSLKGMVGDPTKLTVGGAYQTVYSINYSPDPDGANKKPNYDPKFPARN